MKRRRLSRFAFAAALAGLFAAAPPGNTVLAAEAGTPPRVAVVYPQVRDPYRAVFRAIADGVSSELPGAEVLEIPPEESATALSARLAAQNVGAAVLLGKRGLDLSAELTQPPRRVVGAVLAQPAEVPAGVNATSLAPSPGRLFETLHELAPAVKRIYVIYGSDPNEWLIELARADAARLGYELLPMRKENIRDGASAYRELLGQMKSPTDAIWLPQASPFLEEVSVLQMILRAAWDRSLVVFSSNPSHVPKGALFALFPDNVAMGRQLAQQLGKPAPAAGSLVPLDQLDTAINIRTADHLGLGLNAQDPRFDKVFPESR